MTEEGAAGVLFDGMPEIFPSLQWHSAEVKQMPPGASCLATSPACVVQAMKWETRAYSAQFHLEVEEDTVSNWAAIPEYATALQSALGAHGADQLATAVQNNMKAFNNAAERLYMNWLQTAAQA